MSPFNGEHKGLTRKEEFDKLRGLTYEGKLIPQNKLEHVVVIIFISVVGRSNVRRGNSLEQMHEGAFAHVGLKASDM